MAGILILRAVFCNLSYCYTDIMNCQDVTNQIQFIKNQMTKFDDFCAHRNVASCVELKNQLRALTSEFDNKYAWENLRAKYETLDVVESYSLKNCLLDNISESDDGQRIICSYTEPGTDGSGIYIIDKKNNRRKKIGLTQSADMYGDIYGLLEISDKEQILIGRKQGIVETIDEKTGMNAGNFSISVAFQLNNPVTLLTESKKSQQIIVKSHSNSLTYYDKSNLYSGYYYDLPVVSQITSYFEASHSQNVIVGTSSGELSISNLKEDKHKVIYCNIGAINHVSECSNGQIICAGEEGIKIYSEDGRELLHNRTRETIDRAYETEDGKCLIYSMHAGDSVWIIVLDKKTKEKVKIIYFFPPNPSKKCLAQSSDKKRYYFWDENGSDVVSVYGLEKEKAEEKKRRLSPFGRK